MILSKQQKIIIGICIFIWCLCTTILVVDNFDKVKKIKEILFAAIIDDNDDLSEEAPESKSDNEDKCQ